MTGPDHRLSRRRRQENTALLLIVLAVFFVNAPDTLRVFFRRSMRLADRFPHVPAFTPGQRVLVLAPHPDDESLACGGLIQLAQAAGAQVYIAWITSGDGFELDAARLDRVARPSGAQMLALGRRRRDEALGAADQLGVPHERLSFLGYPDAGLLHLLLEHYDQPYTSPLTQVSAVPYDFAQTPGAPFNGVSLSADLTRLLDRVQPDLVLAPSPYDAHPDHRAVNHFVTRLLAARQQSKRLRYWIIHGDVEYPVPKGLHPSLPLLPPQRGRGLAWQRLDLTPDQVQTKLRAIRAHRSQLEMLNRFMLAFARRN